MTSRFAFGILHRILLALLLVSLIPLATIWAINFNTISELNNTKVEQQLSSLNENLLIQVDDWVDINRRMLQQNARTPDIVSMEASRQNPVLKSMTELYDWAYLVHTIAPDGNNVGRSDGKPLKYYGDRIYFQQAMAGQELGEQILIGKTSGQPALTLAAPIIGNDGKIKGAIAAAATLSEISERITNSRIGQTGFAFLVDAKGEVIAHPSEEFTRARIDLSNHPALKAMKQGKATSIFLNDKGEKVLAVCRRNLAGWILVTQQNVDEAYQLIRSENIKMIILLVGSLVLVLAVAALVSGRLTHPIRELTTVADQFSQGKLELKISGLDRPDEIGNLARAVERLGTSIRLAMERLQKQRAAK